MSTEFENPVYFDLNQVDPNYTAIPAEIYTLKALKLGIATAASGRKYVKATFAVTNHNTHSARRLFKNWFRLYKEDGSLDLGGRDAKELRKLMDVTGVKQTGDFEKWLEDLSTEQPLFVAPVNQAIKTQKQADGTYGPIIGVNGEPEKENVIDFRNAQIAN